MRSIELFAGAGGQEWGCIGRDSIPRPWWSGIAIAATPFARTSETEHPIVSGWPLVEGDVRQIDFKPYEGRLDLISGGPPCQPFSLGGKHKAYDDARDMFPQAIRAVREARPRAFVFENVKGLTRTAFRNYFEYIKLQLEHPELIALPDEDWTDHPDSLGTRAYAWIAGGIALPRRDPCLERRRLRCPAAPRTGPVRRVSRRSGHRVGFPHGNPQPRGPPLGAVSGSLLLGASQGCCTADQPKDSAAMARADRRWRPSRSTRAWRTVRDAIHDLPGSASGDDAMPPEKSPIIASSRERGAMRAIPAVPSTRAGARP